MPIFTPWIIDLGGLLRLFKTLSIVSAGRNCDRSRFKQFVPSWIAQTISSLPAERLKWQTEAASLPILTELTAKPSASIGALYIGPLKALINDQFVRLQGMLGRK